MYINLPDKVKAELQNSIKERRERIAFEKREIEQLELKLSLSYAVLLVVEEGEDGLDFETIVEYYQKKIDAPEGQVMEELVEAHQKGIVSLSSPGHVVMTEKFMREYYNV